MLTWEKILARYPKKQDVTPNSHTSAYPTQQIYMVSDSHPFYISTLIQTFNQLRPSHLDLLVVGWMNEMGR